MIGLGQRVARVEVLVDDGRGRFDLLASVVALDPTAGRLIFRAALPIDPDFLAVGEGTVWAANSRGTAIAVGPRGPAKVVSTGSGAPPFRECS